jgi:hypothetical protein
MRSIRLKILLWPALGLSTAGFAQSPDACAELTAFRIPGVEMVITEAVRVPAAPSSTAPGPGRYAGPLPTYCRADGVIDRRTGADGKPYAIGFAVAMPDNWNHGFLMQGGGGLNSSVQMPLGAQAAGDTPGLARGFAVVSTDSGHTGTGAFDGSFFRDQQATLDFAYVAVGRVAVVAKQIITRYYGEPAAHSYFSGCSTGGREGMLMTQRYPAYFDAVVVGAPAMRTGFSNLADRWVAVSFNQIAPKDAQGNPITAAALSDADRKLVMEALLKHCDAKDGLRDGMIFNLTGCDFDPAVLACGGAKTEACLSAEEVAALHRAFSGPKDSRGTQVSPGFLYDTGIAAKKGIQGLLNPGPSPVGPPAGLQQDVDREAREALNPLTDTTFTKLNTFSRDGGSGHGGKLLFYHGASDPWFSALDTLDYYRRMSTDNGGLAKVTSWSRMYLVPGMGHCGGGESALDRFDMLGAVIDWVEKGVAPEFVLATGAAFPGRSRPLCAYPQYAHYKGQGDPQNAENFGCRE